MKEVLMEFDTLLDVPRSTPAQSQQGLPPLQLPTIAQGILILHQNCQCTTPKQDAPFHQVSSQIGKYPVDHLTHSPHWRCLMGWNTYNSNSYTYQCSATATSITRSTTHESCGTHKLPSTTNTDYAPILNLTGHFAQYGDPRSNLGNQYRPKQAGMGT